ncbi:MAG: glycosyltransferase [Candidatus Glassbacteria bacterium]|nr:glycosyltransferase [Candidatus Glassbacteria bacterium]
MSGKKNKRLLVIVADDLNRIITKGEVTRRYYNPDDFFDEVQIIALMDDELRDLRRLELTVGSAAMSFSRVGRPPLVSTLGWTGPLLGKWLDEVSGRVSVRPDLIRTYGLHLNGLAAVELKKRFNIPLVASVHEVGDRYKKLEIKTCKHPVKKLLLALYAARTHRLAVQTLGRCDEVLCVYQSTADYVERLGYRDPKIIYNAVSTEILPKQSYGLHSPPRLLNVGRQTPGIKGPSNIIPALEGLEAVMDVIGDGPLHGELVRLAAEAGLQEQVNFSSFMPNEEIVSRMRDYDLFVYQYNNWEISKSVIEALLCGLPVIVNRKEDHPVREFENAPHLVTVRNSPAAFRQAILDLLAHDGRRQELGEKAREFASRNYDPPSLEKKVADLYRALVGRA